MINRIRQLFKKTPPLDKASSYLIKQLEILERIFPNIRYRLFYDEECVTFFMEVEGSFYFNALYVDWELDTWNDFIDRWLGIGLCFVDVPLEYLLESHENQGRIIKIKI